MSIDENNDMNLSLDNKIVTLIQKLIKLKKKREKQDYSIKEILIDTISKEIESVKHDNPTIKEISKRNIKRIFDLKGKKACYCPIIKDYMKNLMICHLTCQYGHITECHYPYKCQPDLCNHYQDNE